MTSAAGEGGVLAVMKSYLPDSWTKSGPLVPVLRFTGPIGMTTPLKPGLSLSTAAGAIEKAFSMRGAKAVAIQINSPGGSAVQSTLIYKRIRALAEEKDLKVYVFAEDVAASGGYMLACAGDEIYADESSIVGSIGVISASFGFTGLMEKVGVQRAFIDLVKSRRGAKISKPDNELFTGEFWSGKTPSSLASSMACRTSVPR